MPRVSAATLQGGLTACKVPHGGVIDGSQDSKLEVCLEEVWKSDSEKNQL